MNQTDGWEKLGWGQLSFVNDCDRNNGLGKYYRRSRSIKSESKMSSDEVQKLLLIQSCHVLVQEGCLPIHMTSPKVFWRSWNLNWSYLDVSSIMEESISKISFSAKYPFTRIPVWTFKPEQPIPRSPSLPSHVCWPSSYRLTSTAYKPHPTSVL